MWNTIVQLAAQGHRITFVAPDLSLDHREGEDQLSRHCEAVHLISAQAGSRAPSLIKAVLTERPVSIIRHSHGAVRNFVARAVWSETYDVVHAEQVHTMVNLPRPGSLPPVVLRAQNVESQLWRMVARIKPRMAWLARREARRMSAYEASALSRTATTVALTTHDGTILGGALGNLADRIVYGAVTDWIDVGIGSTRWPTFNVADIGVTVGVLALALLLLRSPSDAGEPPEELTEDP